MTTRKSSKSQAKVVSTDKKSRPQSPLTHSTAEAEREIAKLKSYRERLESEPPAGENDARATLI